MVANQKNTAGTFQMGFLPSATTVPLPKYILVANEEKRG